VTRIYVDTSIILRYCLWRYLEDQVVNRYLLDFFGRGLKGEFEIVISQLSISELASLMENYPISKKMLSLVVEQLRNSPDLSYVRMDVVSKSFFDEINKYSKLGLSPMDAMHIRIAQDVRCSHFATDDTYILRFSKELESEGLLASDFQILSIQEILKILDSKEKGVDDQILYGRVFEDVVREHFENLGYNILLGSPERDLGVDFIVEKEGKKFAIETKLYLNSPVSGAEVRQYLGTKLKDIDGFWIVSPSGFSKEAEKIAKERPDKIKLLNIRNSVKKSYPRYKRFLQSYLEPFYERKIQPEIDFAKLSKHWNKVKSSKTNKEKKDALENLAEFLFNSISGIEVVDKNVRTSAEEIDLILKNESNESFWRQLGSPILVECKNWGKKIGTGEVIIFKDKLETGGIKVGILIAVKGITGTKRKDAILKIREYKQRGYRIVLLTGDDIEAICDGENPTDKFREKYYDIFRF